MAHPKTGHLHRRRIAQRDRNHVRVHPVGAGDQAEDQREVVDPPRERADVCEKL